MIPAVIKVTLDHLSNTPIPATSIIEQRDNMGAGILLQYMVNLVNKTTDKKEVTRAPEETRTNKIA